MISRHATRDRVRTWRAQVTADDAADAARRVAAAVERLPEWPPATTISAYIPGRGELDPAPILALARARGATAYVPVLEGDVLRFAALPDDTQGSWVENRYGIAEPTGTPRLDADALDL